MTKGPIIGAIPLAIFIWSLMQKNFSYLKKPAFYGGVLLALALFSVFLLPVFHIDGRDPFTFFYYAKKGYAESASENFWRYFAYVEVLWTNAAPLFLLSLYAFWGVVGSWFELSSEERAKLRLCGMIALCVVIPLSFFGIKFPHYMLPAYPFMALVAAMPLSQWLKGVEDRLPVWLQRLAVAAVFVLACFPILTSGGRSKEVLNIVNVIKLDPAIREKRVVFLGGYEDDMAIFQSFKWYGSIDLAQIARDELVDLNLKQGYLVVKRADLPVIVNGEVHGDGDCFLRNWFYCVLTDRSAVTLELPTMEHPHQVY